MFIHINPYHVHLFLAYIDPGTGSMLFATLIGLVGVAGYFIKGLWLKIRFILSGGKKVGTEENVIPFVIFSDDKRYWPVFEPVCRELDALGFDTVYMTASPDDPALQCEYKHVRSEFIGTGNKAFVRLNFLKATMLLSTTPGLDVYQWKRSRDVQFYVHITHGANGQVTGYRMFGIDYYDAILLACPCQIDSIRALEKLRGLPEKECQVVGVPYLDELSKRLEKSVVPEHELTVLVAPSWGKNSLLNKFGNKLLDQLIATKYHIIVRPHPQSFTSEKSLLDRLINDYPDLEWNRDIDNFDVLNRSDIMISDYSGVIIDFALVFNKPVICAYQDFDNSQYDVWWLGSPVWAVTANPRIGPTLTDANLSELKELIDTAWTEQKYKDNIREMRDEIWANHGLSAGVAARYIVEKYHALTAKPAITGNESAITENVTGVDTSTEKPGETEASEQLTEMTTDKSTHKRFIERYKSLIVLIAVVVDLLVVVFAIHYSLNRFDENELETEDLETMRSAKKMAKAQLDRGVIQEKTEFWYTHIEHASMRLLPTSVKKPQAYGKGTSLVGHASRDFYHEKGEPAFNYDESVDYTNKIIKVTVAPDTKDIQVTWEDSQ